ncbi:MAG: hypothetical protein ACFBQW_04840 [Sphingomonadaceae bacterium]
MKLAALASSALPSLPGDRPARELFRFVLAEEIGIIEGIELAAGGEDAAAADDDDLFTVGRRAFLLGARDREAHDLAIETCLALHRCEPLRSADGLFALAALGGGGERAADLDRFRVQAGEHLAAMLACFPDVVAQDALRLAGRIEA